MSSNVIYEGEFYFDEKTSKDRTFYIRDRV